jgi:hydroxymethylpyrimidine pyrophosphatase-like HAD family hydrolase
MEEVEHLEQQALRPFCKSFTKRYEQWKRGNLLAVALETMPKQVNKGKVLDNLLKLYSTRAENLGVET